MIRQKSMVRALIRREAFKRLAPLGVVQNEREIEVITDSDYAALREPQQERLATLRTGVITASAERSPIKQISAAAR